MSIRSELLAAGIDPDALREVLRAILERGPDANGHYTGLYLVVPASDTQEPYGSG